VPGERLISRNYGRGPGQFNMNLRSPRQSGWERASRIERWRPSAPTGQGAKLARRRRTGRANRQPDYASLQLKHWAVGAEPVESHERRSDHREHHLALLRFCEPGRARNGVGLYETANNRRLSRRLSSLSETPASCGSPYARDSLAGVDWSKLMSFSRRDACRSWPDLRRASIRGSAGSRPPTR
jgi:hypothetical protein